MSSGLSLTNNSWLPSSVKTNFIRQNFERVNSRCSASLSVFEKNEAIEACTRKLINNGYSETNIRKATDIKHFRKKNKPSTVSKSVLKLPFVNDSLIRKVNALIKKYKLDVNLVSLGNKKLRHTFRGRKPVDKHDNCNVCTKLPQQYKCDKPGVVYQFKCSFCFSTYIGKTSRPFYLRYNEHKNSIKNKNNNSALSDHTKVCDCSSIDDFDINFLRCASDPVDLSLHESRLIDFLKPALNRRHEGAGGPEWRFADRSFHFSPSPPEEASGRRNVVARAVFTLIFKILS